MWIKLSDWLKIRNGCGILIYSAGQGLSIGAALKGIICPQREHILLWEQCFSLRVAHILDAILGTVIMSLFGFA